MSPVAKCATSNLLLQHLDKILTTYIQNSWNPCNIRLKHLHKHMIAITKHMQHPNETLATYERNTWNMLFATSMYMQHLNLLLRHTDKTLETYVWNTWNTENIHLQHAYIVIATHATSQIYFCNIQIKHLKHKSGTPETQRRRWPRPIWWGTAVASKLGSGDVGPAYTSAAECRPIAHPVILPRLLAAIGPRWLDGVNSL
jgi:hypothetical protein